MGNQAGCGGRPGTCGKMSSIVTSDISIKSRSRIFLTPFADMAAAVLKGPGWVSSWSLGSAGGHGGGSQKVQADSGRLTRVEEQQHRGRPHGHWLGSRAYRKTDREAELCEV